MAIYRGRGLTRVGSPPRTAEVNVEHRLPLLNNGSPTRWIDFFAAATADIPIAEGRELARQLSQDHEIVWLTGRPERIREVTEDWLKRNGMPSGALIMHPEGDSRSSVDVKPEQVADLSRTRTVDIVVEDDPRVVHALRRRGFRAIQVPWAAWTPVLGQAWPADEDSARVIDR